MHVTNNTVANVNGFLAVNKNITHSGVTSHCECSSQVGIVGCEVIGLEISVTGNSYGGVCGGAGGECCDKLSIAFIPHKRNILFVASLTNVTNVQGRNTCLVFGQQDQRIFNNKIMCFDRSDVALYCEVALDC